MSDHGLTGTHHIDGSPCYGKQDEHGNVIHDCSWSATNYMQARMRFPPKRPLFFAGDEVVVEAIPGADPTRLWAGLKCEVIEVRGHDGRFVWLQPMENRPDGYGRDPFEWTTAHIRDTRIRKFRRTFGTTVLDCGCGIPWERDHNKKDSIIVCETHGLTTINEFR